MRRFFRPHISWSRESPVWPTSTNRLVDLANPRSLLITALCEYRDSFQDTRFTSRPRYAVGQIRITVIHTERKAQKTRKRTKRYVERIRDRTSKAGRAPESLESSPRATGTVLIRIADYDAQAFNETTAQSIEECRQYTKTPTVPWINV